jgi:hypothetical protein
MWKRITFWNKIQLTVQAVLTLTQLSLIFGDAQHIYNVFVTVGQLVALLIPIWFQDLNNDGQVDLFEKEVTIKVSSDTPVSVETKTETLPKE